MTQQTQYDATTSDIAWKWVTFQYNTASQFSQIERFVRNSTTPIAVATSTYEYDGIGRLQSLPEWKVEIQSHPEGAKKFAPVRKRWVIERTNAWTVRCRRNAKDYERRVDSSAAMIQWSNIHLMARRLAPTPVPAERRGALARRELR